jgi:hypothetical protein
MMEWSGVNRGRRDDASPQSKGGDSGGGDVMVKRGMCDGNNLRPDMMCGLLLS